MVEGEVCEPKILITFSDKEKVLAIEKNKSRFRVQPFQVNYRGLSGITMKSTGPTSNAQSCPFPPIRITTVSSPTVARPLDSPSLPPNRRTK